MTLPFTPMVRCFCMTATWRPTSVRHGTGPLDCSEWSKVGSLDGEAGGPIGRNTIRIDWGRWQALAVDPPRESRSIITLLFRLDIIVRFLRRTGPRGAL